jgi:hypothetical protein
MAPAAARSASGIADSASPGMIPLDDATELSGFFNAHSAKPKRNPLPAR